MPEEGAPRPPEGRRLGPARAGAEGPGGHAAGAAAAARLGLLGTAIYKPKKKLVQTAFGYNARDRVTEDVLVIPERKDGLAVKRPDFMKRAPPPTVSRHNAFQPTSNDLAGLQL